MKRTKGVALLVTPLYGKLLMGGSNQNISPNGAYNWRCCHNR